MRSLPASAPDAGGGALGPRWSKGWQIAPVGFLLAWVLGLCGASPEAEMTASRAQRPTIDQIEDRISMVKQLRERFKEDKVYLRTYACR
jgi:hypothetical protein